jgi:NAD(P)-dependent dehydrogenase (short-subunit alcohol dehydrogenase family)
MIIDLSGHRAIVSGSTAGIGFAIATGLAKTGAAVVINGRQKQTTDKAVQRLSDLAPGAKIEGIAGDLGSRAGIDDFLRRAGDADILVNNLGIFEPKPFTESRARSPSRQPWGGKRVI